MVQEARSQYLILTKMQNSSTSGVNYIYNFLSIAELWFVDIPGIRRKRHRVLTSGDVYKRQHKYEVSSIINKFFRDINLCINPCKRIKMI